MIQFKPFKAIRPTKSDDVNIALERINYFNIIKDNRLNNNSNELQNFSKADVLKIKEKFSNLLKDRILTKDSASYYIYEQEFSSNTKVLGIIGCVSLDDYDKGFIKKHEDTFKEREEEFTQYLKDFTLQPDPVLLTFRENQRIELIISMVTVKAPTLEFLGNDGKSHRLWQVKDRLVMKQLKSAVESLSALYIADGHHRMESSAHYTQFRRENEPDFFGGEIFNYTLAVIIPGNYLHIYDYNRLVKDLNGYTTDEFLEKISKVFTVLEKKEPYYPSAKHHISMYLDGKFYALYINREYRGIPKGLGELDTFLWEKHIMKPILNIDNSDKTSKIDFIKGTGDLHGIIKLKEKVDSGEYKAGFGFYPISIDDLILVSDENKTMPPKSTYIYPKFLSALTTLDLND
ncbi:DUF1015 domain-containing protein [Weeksellaceae bacterium TAE3-ERU29]|nr:DUF1015 domain-containing protein [Weeksellaceae bacterium TAE3-ERU29]